MRSLTHSPSKIGVTGVTRVTTLAKHPTSLAFTAVTRLRDCPYTSCNSYLTCNARLSPRLLWADVRYAWLARECRWLRLQNEGRGIESYTMLERCVDD